MAEKPRAEVMKATYKNHTIIAIKKGDGFWYATIDGVETNIKSHYRRVTVRLACQYLDEQEQAQKFTTLKEVGL